ALSVLLLNSCASGYKKIQPKTINFASRSENNSIVLEYKYDLLEKKYKKKEMNNGLKVIAVKVTNNSTNDLVFGKDIQLTYENGNELNLLETNVVYKAIKQSPASYLWYLLLSPMQFQTMTTNSNGQQQTSSSTPVGLVIGPGLAGGNMIAASSANKNFQSDLTENDIIGKVIKKGETVYGIIGIRSNNYDSIKVK
ncbi:MAG: hypothetical protein RL308_2138, partial [Bacteroidota bacterium]